MCKKNDPYSIGRVKKMDSDTIGHVQKTKENQNDSCSIGRIELDV